MGLVMFGGVDGLESFARRCDEGAPRVGQNDTIPDDSDSQFIGTAFEPNGHNHGSSVLL